MKLFIATGNAHKVGELTKILTEQVPDLLVLGASELGGMPHVDEIANNFEGNALLKAQALHALAPEDSWILADDSGLAVDTLHGAPGILSARYAGPNATDADNRTKLLTDLAGVPESKRHARFVCFLVLLGPDGNEHTFTGTCEGIIALEEQGTGGFGYDPIFRPAGHDDTFGILPPETKNIISHRARALAALVKFLGCRE